jgi:hypothetical protein
MHLNLPTQIAAYFAADRARDPGAVAACFTDDGRVKDEGRVHHGPDAIRNWKAAAASAYSYSVEPVDIDEREGRTIVTGRVTGTFPASPIDLRYFFRLEGARIAELEIAP